MVLDAGRGGRLAEVSIDAFWVTVAYDLAAKEERMADREGATRRDTVRSDAMATCEREH